MASPSEPSIRHHLIDGSGRHNTLPFSLWRRRSVAQRGGAADSLPPYIRHCSLPFPWLALCLTSRYQNSASRNNACRNRACRNKACTPPPNTFCIYILHSACYQSPTLRATFTVAVKGSGFPGFMVDFVDFIFRQTHPWGCALLTHQPISGKHNASALKYVPQS